MIKRETCCSLLVVGKSPRLLSFLTLEDALPTPQGVELELRRNRNIGVKREQERG
jgi:hypothetical protein